MTPNALLAVVIAFAIWSCGCVYAGYKYETASCTASDEKHDLAQAQNTTAAIQAVVVDVKKQSDITQEASNDYAKNLITIDGVYANSVQQSPNGPINSVSTIRSAASGVCPDNSTAKSKVYKLTPKQCDDEEAKCNSLWNWANQQAAVKP